MNRNKKKHDEERFGCFKIERNETDMNEQT